jgi:hypothetical protein
MAGDATAETAARGEWSLIRLLVSNQIDYGDSAPVERAALLAVKDLLGWHKPVAWSGVTGVWCEECYHSSGPHDSEGAEWPCPTYRSIQEAFADGE